MLNLALTVVSVAFGEFEITWVPVSTVGVDREFLDGGSGSGNRIDLVATSTPAGSFVADEVPRPLLFPFTLDVVLVVSDHELDFCGLNLHVRF